MGKQHLDVLRYIFALEVDQTNKERAELISMLLAELISVLLAEFVRPNASKLLVFHICIVVSVIQTERYSSCWVLGGLL